MTSRLMLKPHDMGLILSYQCQAGCAHCLYNCAPQREAWISTQDVHLALKALASLTPPVQVHLTGGEPFLRFELLLEATRMAVRLALPVYAETNAGWCVNQEITRRRFSALRQAGMDAILISVSPFHAERFPLQRTLSAIETAEQIFGTARVMIYQEGWNSTIQELADGGKLPLEAWEQTYGRERAGRLLWEGYGLIAGGRSGYRLGDMRPGLPAEAFEGLACRRDILLAHHSHFDLHGHYIPGFCGGLSLGSWKELDRLYESIRSGEYPPLIELLVRGGPHRLYELARAQYGYPFQPKGYAGKCHLCVDVRRHLKVRADFPELAPSDFYQHF